MAEFTIAWADGLTRRPFQVSSGSVRAPQPQPSADVPPDAPLPPDMVVFVRMLSGEAVELDVAADDSVATVKAKLEQRVDVPLRAQRLLRPGHASPLADASTLRASGVATAAHAAMEVARASRPAKRCTSPSTRAFARTSACNIAARCRTSFPTCPGAAASPRS